MLKDFLSTAFVFFMLANSCAAQSNDQPIAIDGQFGDWDRLPVLANDPVGDRGASGIDFRTLRVESDAEWIYISFQTESDLLLQQDNPLKLYLDTDASESTGIQFAGIGAELIWDFPKREGQVRLASTLTTVQHPAIGYIPAPSMTSSRFEIALRRDAEISGRRLYSSNRIRVVLRADEAGGDLIPDQDGGVTVELRDIPAPRMTERTLEPAAPGSIRILSWNVLQNGLVDPVRGPIFERMLKAVKPDVMCFQECFELNAAQVQAMVAATLVAPDGRSWRALKTDAGNIMVTHFDIESDWLIQPSYRESAYLLRTPDGKPLLVINAHLRCCNANEKRQKEADGVIAFLRDARTAGDRIDLPQGTPMIMVGDFNLVGDRQQFTTLLTGDISDNTTHGPDSPPDWDGGAWTELPPVHPTSLFNYTWYDTGSDYAPGKLDYVLYTSSAADVVQHLVFNTTEMSDAQLSRHGLQRDDAVTASDHMPRVIDIVIKNAAGTGSIDPPARPELGAVYPQPAQGILHIEMTHAAGPGVQFSLFDMLGRTMLHSTSPRADFADARHMLTLPHLPAGAYLLTATGETSTSHRRVMLR